MTIEQIIRAAMPGATPEMAEYVLWNRTAFPFKKMTAQELYKKASGFNRACKHGIQLCDFCDRPAVDGWNCQPCIDALAQANRQLG